MILYLNISKKIHKSILFLVFILLPFFGFSQKIKPTKQQQERIYEIFTPDYVIESSKTISIMKEQDSVIRVRDIQIKELQDKIENLKKVHKETLIAIAKQNNIAKESSKKIDSITDNQLSKLKFNWNGIHMYGGTEIPQLELSKITINTELMYEFSDVHFGFKFQFEPIPFDPDNKYRFNYLLKVRYKLF